MGREELHRLDSQPDQSYYNIYLERKLSTELDLGLTGPWPMIYWNPDEVSLYRVFL